MFCFVMTANVELLMRSKQTRLKTVYSLIKSKQVLQNCFLFATSLANFLPHVIVKHRSKMKKQMAVDKLK